MLSKLITHPKVNHGTYSKAWIDIITTGGDTVDKCKVVRDTTAKLIRENQRLRTALAEERERRLELEDAVLELGTLYAEQDDALVELAEMMEV